MDTHKSEFKDCMFECSMSTSNANANFCLVPNLQQTHTAYSYLTSPWLEYFIYKVLELSQFDKIPHIWRNRMITLVLEFHLFGKWNKTEFRWQVLAENIGRCDEIFCRSEKFPESFCQSINLREVTRKMKYIESQEKSLDSIYTNINKTRICCRTHNSYLKPDQ